MRTRGTRWGCEAVTGVKGKSSSEAPAAGAPAARAGLRLQLEEFRNLFDEIVRQTWLRDEAVAPGRARSIAFGRERVGAEGDDDQVRRRRVALEDPSRLPSVQSWQRQIHEYEIRTIPSGLLERFVPVPGGVDLKAGKLQIIPIHLARIVVVFYEQDTRSGIEIRHFVVGRTRPSGS
jgi:hypothetical protein